MRNQERMQHLYAQRRQLRETARQVREQDGASLHQLRERQTSTGMQLTMMRRRAP
jgi:hypothetical protein